MQRVNGPCLDQGTVTAHIQVLVCKIKDSSENIATKSINIERFEHTITKEDIKIAKIFNTHHQILTSVTRKMDIQTEMMTLEAELR